MWFVDNHKLENTRGLKLELNGHVLGEVNEFKYLGIWLDRDLRFKKQLEPLDNQVGLRLMQLKKTRAYLNQADAIVLYNNTIEY